MNFPRRDVVPPAELLESLRNRDNFLVATHVNPDGDAIGSALALAMALEKMGKRAVLIDKHRVPDHYRFLPGQEKFQTFESLQSAGYRASDFSTLVLVDCNEPERIGLEKKEQSPVIEEYKKAVAGGLYAVVIDHHETEKDFGDIKWVAPKAAATGVMAYYLIRSLGMTINPEIATNLYAAIVIDTGNFRYENTTAEVMSVGAELIDCGARPNVIYEQMYESWSGNRFRLYLKMIGSLDIRDDVAFGVVTKKMFEETSTTTEDTESFVSFPRIIKNINVSVMLREIGENEYKVSLRSKGDISVAGVAEHFHGGGHKHAAGCRIKADIETAKTLIFDKVKDLNNR